MKTKTITLHFNVPADVDLASENLLRLRDLLLLAAREYLSSNRAMKEFYTHQTLHCGGVTLSTEDQQLVRATLYES